MVFFSVSMSIFNVSRPLVKMAEYVKAITAEFPDPEKNPMLSLRKERSEAGELRECVTRVSVTPSVLNLPADVRCRVKVGKATIKDLDGEQRDRISPRAAARAVVRSAGVGLRGASALEMAKILDPKRRTLTRRAWTAASTPQGPPLCCTSPKLRSRCVLNRKA